MSKLPQVSGREIIKALQKIGFVVVSQRGSHVKLERNPFDKLRAGKRNLHQTVIVPMHKVIKKGTLRNGILKPINLTVDQFVILLKK